KSSNELNFVRLSYNHTSGYHFQSNTIDYSLTSLTRVKGESTKEDCGIWIDSHYDLIPSLFNTLETNDSQEMALTYNTETIPEPEPSLAIQLTIQTIHELILKLETNTIYIFYDRNFKTLVTELKHHVQISHERTLFLKDYLVDIDSVSVALKLAFQETVNLNKRVTYLVLCNDYTTNTMMVKAKDSNMLVFDIIWITQLLRHVPVQFDPFFYLSFHVNGYSGDAGMMENNVFMLGDVLRQVLKRAELPSNIAYQLESKTISEISLYTNSKWNTIFEMRSNLTTTEMLQQKSSINYELHSTFLGTTQQYVEEILLRNKPIRVVSIPDGPFLFVDQSHYLKDGVCMANTVICRQTLQNESNTTRTSQNESNTVWINTCCFGYTVDLISSISNLLDLKFEIYLVEDNKYGGYDPEHGTFNGLIGDIIKRKADVALAGLTINSQRSKYVDFTTPFMRTEIGILTLKKIEKNKNYFNMDFIANLAEETQYAIIALYTLSLFILCGIDNCALYFKDQFDRKYRNRRHEMYPVAECFSYISGLSFQRDLGGKNPRSFGGRVTAIFFAFGMVAVSTVYTASLTASKVVVSQQAGFKGLKDPRFVNPTEDFKFATNKDTSIETFFEKSPDPSYHRMYLFMRKYNVETVDEGINKVLNGQLQAYLNEYTFLNYMIPKLGQCKVVLHSNTVGESGYGMAVGKNSYLKHVLSQAILILSEKKELAKLEQRWLSNVCKTDEIDANEKFSLNFFATPFMFIALFACLLHGNKAGSWRLKFLQRYKSFSEAPFGLKQSV
uniref:Uncharacterized protein n=2 Tax=Clytia hemisphaerica TaxID=252671 RepID=A0A7M5VEH9_9CNID